MNSDVSILNLFHLQQNLVMTLERNPAYDLEFFCLFIRIPTTFRCTPIYSHWKPWEGVGYGVSPLWISWTWGSCGLWHLQVQLQGYQPPQQLCHASLLESMCKGNYLTIFSFPHLSDQLFFSSFVRCGSLPTYSPWLDLFAALATGDS